MQNNPQMQGGGGNTTRTLIITAFSLAGAVGLFFIGRSIYKTLTKDTSGSGGSPSGGSGSTGGGTTSSSSSTTTTTTVVEPPKPTYNPNADAAALHKTMDGGGTDDDGFWRITNRLNSEQKIAVKARFTQMYGSLKDWIEGDFSWSAEDRALRAWGYPA